MGQNQSHRETEPSEGKERLEKKTKKKGKDKESVEKKSSKEETGKDEKAKEDKKHLIRFFFKDAEFPMKVFTGTPQSEIETFVKRQISVPDATVLRYLDEDGDTVVLSSHIPDGEKIFVVTVKSAPKVEEIPVWTWDPDTKQCSSHVLTNSSKRFGQDENHGIGGIAATHGFTSGKHYWKLYYENLTCCVTGGVAWKADGHGALKWIMLENTAHFSEKLLGEDSWSKAHSGEERFNVEVGFLLDIEERTLRIFRDGERKCRLKFTGLPKNAKFYPAARLKHVVHVTITATNCPIPSNLDLNDASKEVRDFSNNDADD